MMPEITYPTSTQLSKPKNGEKIPNYTIAYLNERHRNSVHSFVLDCMAEAQITQAELARRLGKAPELINRKIGAPGNWTLDSVSELLFAINGCEPMYSKKDFLAQAVTNLGPPEWMESEIGSFSNLLETDISVSATEQIGHISILEQSQNVK